MWHNDLFVQKVLLEKIPKKYLKKNMKPTFFGQTSSSTGILRPHLKQFFQQIKNISKTLGKYFLAPKCLETFVNCITKCVMSKIWWPYAGTFDKNGF